MLIGYSRVSTDEQSLNSQVDKLKEVGCERIFTDVISSRKEKRPGLQELLKFARTNDIIVVSKLDRLSRSLKEIISLFEIFKNKELGFKSLSENIDTTTSTGKLIFYISAIFAEFERDLISERTKAGLKAARARGRIGGRPTVLDADTVQLAQFLHRNTDNSITSICKRLGISKASLYKALKQEQNPSSIVSS